MKSLPALLKETESHVRRFEREGRAVDDDSVANLSGDHIKRNRESYERNLPSRYRSYTFESLRVHAGNRAAVDAAKALQPGENLFIHGRPGNGKTHLAVATGHHLAGVNTVEFWGVAKLFSILRAAAVGDADKPNLERAKVLILDDLGKVKTTDFVYQEFYTALEQRWANELTTIFTANHGPLACAQQLSSDEASASAILSRMASGVVVQVEGADERLSRK